MLKPFFVISRYKEDYSWIKDYDCDYLVFNKGDPIEDSHVRNVDNLGGNQRDICTFIYFSFFYDRIPEKTIFVQANPWDHCPKDIFDIRMLNDYFTDMTFYGFEPANSWEARDPDSGFRELNNSWYIDAHNKSRNQTCRYSSFDEFMVKYFEDYDYPKFIRFSPGSQYLVTKKDIHYPPKLWYNLMMEMNSVSPTEAHIIERALYYILTGKYRLRKEFYE